MLRTNTWTLALILFCCDGVDVMYNCGTTNNSMDPNLQVAMDHGSWNPLRMWKERRELTAVTGPQADHEKNYGWCPAGSRDLCLLQSFQTASGAHPVSYSMDKRGPFPVNIVTAAWSWPLTLVYCNGYEWVVLYIHSPTCIHGMQETTLP
jgi:hypothetical protein